MREIAIVGAGQAGLQLGFGLLARGYAVTVYSDRAPEEMRNGRPSGGNFMFDRALSYERELGVNFWDAELEWGEGIHLDFSVERAQRVMTVAGRLTGRGQAIDPRLKSSRWMMEFQRRGGLLVVEHMTVERLERVAAEHELVLVAAGRGELSELFERDAARSVYTAPRRNLFFVVLTGLRRWPGVDFSAVKFLFTATSGEIFVIPYCTLETSRAYAVLFEAHFGGEMDRFEDVNEADQVIPRAKALLHEFAPWVDDVVADIQLADPLSWSKGTITPTVRKPVGRLLSGKLVMGVADTVVLNDPIAGQGSNAASKMAHFLTERIVAWGDRPFTAEWMQAQFEDFWLEDARHIVAFSNLLLEPVPRAAQQVLEAASQDPTVASRFYDCFDNPQNFWPWIVDEAEAQAFVRRVSRSI
jgi:2-polyprenyl-6-methoxyphenol hydroxylase-like FAD-dependent oxidoreductase